VLFLGLSLRGLTRHAIWLDEAYSLAVARQGFLSIASSLKDASGPPLYYWILHIWIALFGDGPTGARSLSIVFGVLLVGATALLGHRLGGTQAGLAAGFVMAATPMAVQFGQETRMYTLLPLLAVLAAERLLAYTETGSRQALLAHVALLAAALYTHNWGLLLVPGAVTAAVAVTPRPRVRGALLGIAAAILLYAPWVPVLRAQAGAASYLFIEMVQAIPAWELPFRSLVLFGSGVGTTGGEARSLLPGAGGGLVACAWCLLILAGLLGPRGRERLAVLFMGAIPLAAAAAYSGLVRPIYLLGRYEIMVLPLFLALVAACAASLVRGGALAGLVALWTLMLAILSLGYAGRIERRFPEEGLAGRLAPALRDGDLVVFTGLYRAAMEYYLMRSGAPFRAASFPPDVARHLGWFYDSLYRMDDPGLAGAARADCPAEGRRTWVIATRTRTSDLLLKTLDGCSRVSGPFADLGPPWNCMLLAVPRDDSARAAGTRHAAR